MTGKRGSLRDGERHDQVDDADRESWVIEPATSEMSRVPMEGTRGRRGLPGDTRAKRPRGRLAI